jgi:CHAD domain-containing protein
VRVQDFDLDVVLYAAEGDRAPHGQLTEDEKERYKKYLKKRFKGMRPFWKGQLTVTGSAATGDFLALVNNQLVKRGSRDWRELVSLCRTKRHLRRPRPGRARLHRGDLHSSATCPARRARINEFSQRFAFPSLYLSIYALRVAA